MIWAIFFLCIAVLVLAAAAAGSASGIIALICVVLAFVNAFMSSRFPQAMPNLSTSEALPWVLLVAIVLLAAYIVLTKRKTG